jgi:hypothetical protein
MEKKIISLRKDFLKDKSKIEKFYKEALEYEEKLKQINILFLENKKVIDTIK